MLTPRSFKVHESVRSNQGSSDHGALGTRGACSYGPGQPPNHSTGRRARGRWRHDSGPTSTRPASAGPASTHRHRGPHRTWARRVPAGSAARGEDRDGRPRRPAPATLVPGQRGLVSGAVDHRPRSRRIPGPWLRVLEVGPLHDPVTAQHCIGHPDSGLSPRLACSERYPPHRRAGIRLPVSATPDRPAMHSARRCSRRPKLQRESARPSRVRHAVD
jgi:hypothetical protein